MHLKNLWSKSYQNYSQQYRILNDNLVRSLHLSKTLALKYRFVKSWAVSVVLLQMRINNFQNQVIISSLKFLIKTANFLKFQSCPIKLIYFQMQFWNLHVMASFWSCNYSRFSILHLFFKLDKSLFCFAITACC